MMTGTFKEELWTTANAADLALAVKTTKEDHPSGWFFFCKI
jgi:hypothetical protein